MEPADRHLLPSRTSGGAPKVMSRKTHDISAIDIQTLREVTSHLLCSACFAWRVAPWRPSSQKGTDVRTGVAYDEDTTKPRVKIPYPRLRNM